MKSTPSFALWLRPFIRWFVIALVGCANANAQDYSSTYVYRQEVGEGKPVCEHMERVYRAHFTQPWKVAMESQGAGAFPTFPGISEERTRLQEVGLLFSRYPSSTEFEKINWREGRREWGTPNRRRTSPILVSEFDWDNDGKEELVIKTQFMLSFYPAGRGAPGGHDEYLVIEGAQFDFSKPVANEDLRRAGNHGRLARIAPDLLGIDARLIRPFKYHGTVFLHVYEQLAIFEDGRKEHTSIYRYKGGGRRLADGRWSPLDAELVCRFQMLLAR